MWPVLMVNGARDATGWIERWSFEDLLQRLTYLRNAKTKIDAPGWLPVRIKEEAQQPEQRFYPDHNAQTWTQRQSGKILARRRASNIAAIWALVVDIDQGFPIQDSAEVQRLQDQPHSVLQMQSLNDQIIRLELQAIGHTTWSSTDQGLKARIVFPFSAECPAERWPEVWEAAQRWAASWGAIVDPACKDPSRLYFLPAAPFDRPFDGMCAADVRGFHSDRFDHFVTESGSQLCWRQLLHDWTEPEPPAHRPRPQPKSGGQDQKRLDGTQKQRRRFALAFLERRAKKSAEALAGQRNQALYGNARACGRHVVSGMLTQSEVETQLAWAGLAAGLSQKEADQAIANGMAKAQEDGPWIY